MRIPFALLATIPLALAGSSSLKMCTKANYAGKCSTIDLTWNKCYKLEKPYYKNLGSAKVVKTIMRGYSSSECAEHNMVVFLTSASDGKDLGADGKRVEYVLLQSCTGCE